MDVGFDPERGFRFGPGTEGMRQIAVEGGTRLLRHLLSFGRPSGQPQCAKCSRSSTTGGEHIERPFAGVEGTRAKSTEKPTLPFGSALTRSPNWPAAPALFGGHRRLQAVRRPDENYGSRSDEAALAARSAPLRLPRQEAHLPVHDVLNQPSTQTQGGLGNPSPFG